MVIRVVDLKAMRQRIVLNLIAIAIACGVGMDSTGGFVVGLIEDSIRVSLWCKAKNIRGNHFRAWSRTFEYVTSHFKDDFKELKKQTSAVAD